VFELVHKSPNVAHIVLCLSICFTTFGCHPVDGYVHLSGATMGTHYAVTAKCELPAQAVEKELATVNGEMSTYDSESMLSRFNRANVGEWWEISIDLAEVIEAAQSLSERSNGAFDVTVGPLVNLWGFGPEARTNVPEARTKVPEVPDSQAIAAAHARVGFRHLSVRRVGPGQSRAELRKDIALSVDLSAIAKGHGVDRLALRLETLGCFDYLVDIGGEVRVAGVNPQGDAWRVGVEVPNAGEFGGVQRILQMSEGAIATSGDYRNFFEVDGTRYSHTIDPRSGMPVTHALASVSVVHESAMWADGFATTIAVLGPEAGFAFAEKTNLSALFIIRTASGFEERYTGAMTHYVHNLEGPN